MEQRTIRTAVIGYGLAGRVFHAPFINATPGLELVGVMQRTGDTAAQAYPGIKTFRSLEEVLASDVEFVAVGTPNETHFPIAKQVIAAGKHLVVDKPVSTLSAEAAELEKLAAAKGVVYAPFHNRRWDGDFLTARLLIESGELGRIVTFESHFDRFRPSLKENSWRENAGDAQSLIFDLGPHLLDQALALFGRPDFIHAQVFTDRDKTAIEDGFDITLNFTRGGHAIRAYLRSTSFGAAPGPRFWINGTRGTYRKFGLDPQEPAIVNGAKVPPIDGNPWLREDAELWGERTIAVDPNDPKKLERRSVETIPGDYRNFYANVRDTILGKAQLAVPPRDAVRTIRLLEMARASSVQRCSLPILDSDWQ